jgi:hypothetical protein
MPETLQMFVYALAFLVIPCVFEVYVLIHKRRANERERLDRGSLLPPNDRFARDKSSSRQTAPARGGDGDSNTIGVDLRSVRAPSRRSLLGGPACLR